MEYFNLKNRIKMKWTWVTMFLVGAISIGTFSCDDDNDDDATPEGTVEAASAYLQVYDNETPSGSISYMRVSENVPDRIDLSQSVELGQDVSVVSHEENIYAINPFASTITKWAVDKSTLELRVDGALSFASTGITTTGTTVFASATQCFVADLFEGVILEWDPASMKITKVHNVEQAALAGSNMVDKSMGPGFLLSSGKVGWSMNYFPTECCDDPFGAGVPIVAIFDPATEVLSYKSHPKQPGGGFAMRYADGNVYTIPGAELGFNRHFLNDGDEADYYILKLDEDGDFDPSFEFNFNSVVDVKYRSDVFAVEGDNLVLYYYTFPEHADNWDDRWFFWGMEGALRFEIINMGTNEVRSFTAFDDYNGGAWPTGGSVDGAGYFQAFSYDDGTNQGYADLYRQESIDSYTLVTKGSPGVGIRTFDRLW